MASNTAEKRDPASDSGAPGDSWKKALRPAFEDVLTAWLFAIAVGLLIAGLLSLGVRPVLMLQSWGVDMGLKIIAQPGPWYRFATPDALPDRFTSASDAGTPKRSFMFIDLVDFEDNGCAQFLTAQRDISDAEVAAFCTDVTAPPAELFSTMVKALNQKPDRDKPSVVVFDYRISKSAGAVGTVAAAEEDLHNSLKESTVPIILPAGLDWIGSNQLNSTASEIAVSGRDKSGVIEDWSSGELKLAGYLTYRESDMNDGVVRGVPPFYRVQGDTVADHTTRILPSAAFLAALIANGATDCVNSLYTSAPSEIPRHCDTILNSPSDAHEIHPFRVPRQVFSLFSLSIPESQMSEMHRKNTDTLTRFYHGQGTPQKGLIYERRKLVDFLSEDKTHIDRLFKQIDFANKIVVVGTSSLKAHDWHKTSLGDMPGPEVIINAIRAFMYFDPIVIENNFTQNVKTEILFAFVAAVGLFIPVWLREIVSRCVKTLWTSPNDSMSPATASRYRRLWNKVTGRLMILGSLSFLWIFLWLAGIVLAFAASLSLTSYCASSDPSSALDFLIPTLLVIFETSVELATLFFAAVRTGVAKLIDHVALAFALVKKCQYVSDNAINLSSRD